jgi:hypothetical protein
MRLAAPLLAASLVLGATPAFAQAGGGGRVARPATGHHWYDEPADGVPDIAIRPFFELRREGFVAEKTFDAVFGQTSASFWGGGAQVLLWRGRVYGEVNASRLLESGGQLTGQRVFVSSAGDVSRLGIPLRAKIQPLEVLGGYRFNLRLNGRQQIIPFVGAGVSRYHYTESSDFAAASENVDATRSGFVFEGGVEYRVHKWVGIAGDAHYDHVPGILGTGGASQVFAAGTIPGATGAHESDLGGWAVRLKVVVGR